MTAVLNQLGTNLATLDTLNPFAQLTAGEGHAAGLRVVEDSLPLSVAFTSAVANFGRFCRFPANVKIKRFTVFFDAIPDTNAVQTLSLDFGVAFSDSTIDGTPPQFQGLLPTTVGIGGGSTTGGTTTTSATYATPNKQFGTVTLSGNNVSPNLIGPTTSGSIQMPLDLTFNGALANFARLGLMEVPNVEIYNFLDGRLVPIENLGWFDIYVRVQVAAATGAAANLIGRLEYTD